MAYIAKENRLNSAAIDGLLLSAITIVASLVNSLADIKEIIPATLLWMVKFGGCIYMLTHIMRRYSSRYTGMSYRGIFKYGAVVCFFSSLVCSGYMLLSLTILFPEQLNAAIEQINTMIESGALANADQKAVELMIAKLPKITFVTSFIYYNIIGAVMCSVIANFTKKD